MDFPILVSAVFVGSLFPSVLAETYYVTPDLSTPCSGNPCMTLSQYATYPSSFFAANTTLLLLPGDHSLSSTLRVTNILHMEIFTSTTFHTRVLCENSVNLEWTMVQTLYISGLHFTGCTLNTFISVNDFVLENCILQQGQYRYEPLLDVRGITEVQIVASTFTGVSQRSRPAITVSNSHLNVIGAFFSGHHAHYSSIVYAFNASIEIEGSTFTENTVQGGYLLDADDSVVIIYNSTFRSNVASCCSSSAVLRVEDSTVIVEEITIGNNTGNNWMRGITTAKSNITINSSMFTDSNSQSNGGIHASDSNLIAESCVFRTNIAAYNSHLRITRSAFHQAVTFVRLLYAFNTILEIESSTFTDINIQHGFDMIYASECTVRVESSSFTNNTVSSIMRGWNSAVLINNSMFTNNTARAGGVVAGNSNIIIQGSIFKGIIADYSGCVLNTVGNSTIITNSSFSDNTAGQFGGVVYASDNCISIASSTFTNNAAGRDGGVLYGYRSNVTASNDTFCNNTADECGGAIKCNECNVTFTHDVFQSNRAERDGGAVDTWKSSISIDYGVFNNNTALEDGGAVETYESIVATITNSNFSHNKANRKHGSAVCLQDQNITIMNATFANNQAGEDGGAILCDNCNLTVIHDVFQGNRAVRNGGAVNCHECHATFTDDVFKSNRAERNGGAVRAWKGSISISHCAFINNTALGHGGAMDTSESITTTVTNTNLSNSTASDSGGAIHLYDQNITIVNATFTNNQASESGGAVLCNECKLFIILGKFQSNRAEIDGGAVCTWNSFISIDNGVFNNNVAFDDGGAVLTGESTVTIISNTIFNKNTAIDQGGAVAVYEGNETPSSITNSSFNNNAAGEGGGAVSVWMSTMTVSFTTISGNIASFWFGGGVVAGSSSISIANSHLSNNTAGYSGGGLAAWECTLDIQDTTFASNVATRDGGAMKSGHSYFIANNSYFMNNTAGRNGGGINTDNCTATVYSCSFDDNNVNSSGGSLSIWFSTSNISNSTFHENSAAKDGGVIITWDSMVVISGSQFRSNTARANGGVLYLSHSALSMERCVFMGNAALDRNGGVVDASESTIYVTDCTLTSNSAHQNGGVVDASNSTIMLTNCNLTSNSAYRGGGVLEASDSILVTDNSTFGKNSALNWNGGVMNIFYTTATVRQCTFTNNVAQRDGGVMDALDSTVTIVNCTFKNNIASHDGGVLDSRSSTATIVNSSFISNRAYFSGVLSGHEYSQLIIHRSSFHSNIADNRGGTIGSYHSNISILTCSLNNNTAFQGGVVYAEYSNVTIYKTNSSCNKGHYGGLLALSRSNSTLCGTNVTNNTANNDGGVIYVDESTVNFTDMMFTHNTALGGAGVLHITSSSLNSEGFLTIMYNKGMNSIVNLEMSSAMFSGITMIENNYRSVLVLRSNVIFSGQSIFANNTKTPVSGTSELEEFSEGGALTILHSTVTFSTITKMMYNRAEKGGAISVFYSTVYMHGDTTFECNTATSLGGAIYGSQTTFNVVGKVNITGNIAYEKGGGMYAADTKTNLLARGSFLQYQANLAKRGGGVCFEEYSKLYIVKHQAEYLQGGSSEGGPRVEFTGNSADYGGAMYISDDTNTDTCSSKSFVVSSKTNECFLQTLANHSSISPNLNTVNTHFFNNSARLAGSDLYGGLLDRCTVNPLAEVFLKDPNIIFMDGVSYIEYITDISLNSITSDPVRLCFCRDGQPDCSYQPYVKYLSSDSIDQLSVVAVDQINRTIPTMIYSSLNPQTLYEDFPQNVTESCTDLGLSSLQSSTRVILYPNGPCNQAGTSQRFIDVVSLFCSCPIGFQPSTSETGCVCVCDSSLHPYITRCSFELASVLREGRFWVTFANNTSPVGFQLHPNCPYDYCLPTTTPVYINFNIPQGADSQCAHNRSGIMCGTCNSGLSVTFGSSHCKSCSSQWLVLLLPFALCGAALVAFLLVCNMTVAVGTINGLLLYADVVNAYSTIFYPFEKPVFLSVFIAWLSLDFGIETCFYNGMDAYAKAWLQFLFPFYITAFAAVLSVVSHYSHALTRLLSNRLVPFMATVVFLSCSKLFRIMVTALSLTKLDYPDGSHDIVWLLDPSVVYLKGKHIPLFVAGVLIGVVGSMYTLLLFIGHWVLHYPVLSKMKAFLNAHYAPFTPKHSFFFGLLVMVRLVLYLVSAFNIHGDPNVSLVSIMMVLVLLLSLKLVITGKIYNKWLVGTIETSFICNIMVFTIATLYVRETNGNQSVVSYISTGVAVATFIGILFYHIFMFIFREMNSLFEQRSGNGTDEYNMEPIEIDVIAEQ